MMDIDHGDGNTRFSAKKSNMYLSQVLFDVVITISILLIVFHGYFPRSFLQISAASR